MDAPQSADSGDGSYENENGDTYLPHERGLWTELAPIESTGTWLRRGFWYAETDAVIYNRLWNRKDQRFAAEDPNVTVNGPVTPIREMETAWGSIRSSWIRTAC